MLCLSIFANDTCTIHSKDHMEILDTDVVNDLIKRPLHKCRIDSNNGAYAIYSESTSKGNSMLFSDTHVKVAFREPLMHFFQTGTLSHRGCDANDRGILLSNIDQSIGKNLGISRRISGILFNGA